MGKPFAASMAAEYESLGLRRWRFAESDGLNRSHSAYLLRVYGSVNAEGPDGVGKTTTIDLWKDALVQRSGRFEFLSFPGKAEGTLGAVVGI